MATASQKIAGETKTKAKAKCGFPGCRDAAAAGGKLQVTPLESNAQYAAADKGLVSSCKFHRMCVGFEGLDPDTDQGPMTKPSCGGAGKVIFLNRAFCLSCHLVFVHSLLAQVKPKLTADVVLTVRRKVVADHVKEDDQEEADPEEANIDAARKLLEAHDAKKKAGGKKAGGKKAGGTTVVTAGAGLKTKTVKKAAPAPQPSDDEEVSESADETDEMEVQPAKTKVSQPPAASAAPQLKKEAEPAAPAASKDEFEELEEKPEAAPQQSSPTGPPLAGAATIVNDPLKAASKAAKAKAAVARA